MFIHGYGAYASRLAKIPRYNLALFIHGYGAYASRLAKIPRYNLAMIPNRFSLSMIAHGRSGDKGNHSNIAVIAYTKAGFAWLREHLTAEVVARYFAPLGPSRVERFEAPNLGALNFVLYDALAGGASRSLRIDTQGKTFALALLQMPVTLPSDLSPLLRPPGKSP